MSKDRRHAKSPRDLGWRDYYEIAKRTFVVTEEDNISVLAAGVAFFSFLSLFPAIGVAVSLYGLVSDPEQVQAQLLALAQVLPAQAREVLQGQLERVASQNSSALGLGLLLSLAFATWSSHRALKASLRALTTTQEEVEGRGYLKVSLIAMGLTFAGIVAGTVLLGLVAVVPVLLEYVGIDAGLVALIDVGRWPLATALVLVSITVLYRLGPDRRAPKWRWLSPGSLFATVGWLAVSAGFSTYVSHFDRYDESYGSVAAVVILMMWLYLSAYVVLLGSELNAVMELYVQPDTTVGPDRPMGERGAYVADHVEPPLESSGG